MHDELVKVLRGCVLSKPCDGCPYYDPNGPTEKCATLNIAAADAIEELMRRCEQFQYMPPPAWIPVTERLPEIGKTVLVWYLWQDEQRHSIAFDEMIINSVTMKPKWNRHHLQNHVTHWMPLPAAPKEARE